MPNAGFSGARHHVDRAGWAALRAEALAAWRRLADAAHGRRGVSRGAVRRLAARRAACRRACASPTLGASHDDDGRAILMRRHHAAAAAGRGGRSRRTRWTRSCGASRICMPRSGTIRWPMPASRGARRAIASRCSDPARARCSSAKGGTSASRVAGELFETLVPPAAVGSRAPARSGHDAAAGGTPGGAADAAARRPQDREFRMGWRDALAARLGDGDAWARGNRSRAGSST